MKKNSISKKEAGLGILIVTGLFIFFGTMNDVQAFECGTDTVFYGGDNYQTIQIGTQCWFKENLDVGVILANGSTMPSDPIPVLNDPSSVQKWCYDASSCDVEGGLYTWAEANALSSSCNTVTCIVPDENQGICPTDWHIPTDTEYKTMEIALGMTQLQADSTSYRGTDQGSKLSLFTSNGNNSSGFTGLMAGVRLTNGTFVSRGGNANFWVASEVSGTNAWNRYLDVGRTTVGRSDYPKADGMSIRCIKNDAQISSINSSATTSITTTQAMGNGNVTNTGGENPERLIEWGTTSNTYTQECTAGTGGIGTYSCDMTSLISDTTYYVRAKAINSAGTSYGSETNFTTLPTEVVILDPNNSEMQQSVDNGYITVDNGTIDNTTQTTTQVQVTFQSNTTDAIFPDNTVITEQTNQNFDFSSFVTENTLTSEQVNLPNAVGAVRIGVPGISLDFTNDITMEITVSEAYNGMILDVLSREEGAAEGSEALHTTCTVTNGICTFTTDHATTYIVNGDGTISGLDDLNLNVEVNATLSMDCYDKDGVTGDYDVILGTTSNPGLVTAGTPAVGQSTCIVTTNDTQGYYLSIINDNGISNTTLVHSNNTDEIPDLTQFNESTKVTENWNAPTTKGLGFSVIQFPQADTTNNTFNNVWTTSGNLCEEGTTSDDAQYAGVPQTDQAIAAHTAYNSTSTTTDVCYKVDVSPSQPSGVYTGSVTYTATSDASGFYQ
ncbi:MAG: FISUMP domain-containing protein [Candidatus Moraniibacteriota bacterium]